LTVSAIIFAKYSLDRRIVHIATVALSHILLTFFAISRIMIGRIRPTDWDYWMLILAFILTDYAIVNIHGVCQLKK
jgi:hypothetical protein